MLRKSAPTRQPDVVAVASRDAGGPPREVVVVAGSGRQTVWWVLTVVLAVIATAMVLRRDESFLIRSALAQMESSPGGYLAGARGIHAFSGPLTSRTYGVFMLDVDSGTLWCYELDKAANNELQLRLVAARSWRFDRYLEEFNVAEPIPAAVRAMVEQQSTSRGPDRSALTPDGAGDPAAGPALP